MERKRLLKAGPKDGVGVISYAYDDAGRLTSLENPFSETTSFTYDDGNRLTRKDFESGQYEATSYDTRNRITQVLLKNSGNTTLRTQSWTYDNASNVATMTQAGVTITYGYDDIDQLTSESRTGYSASYTYDANGNRATRTVNSATENYTYDDADKLDYIQVSGSTTKDYSYDSAGRTTSVAVTGVGTTSLTYDYEGRITQITYPNASTNTFSYNGLDTRVSKVDSGGTKTYLRDGAGVTASVLNDGAANYTPGTSERRSSTTTYYHGGIKNAETQSNTSQTVTASVTFDAFGNVDTSSGTWKGPFGYGGPFGYQSDPDSGLKLLGHRYYDSSTGRFLTRDPAKDGRNWYVYCASNSTSYYDDFGLKLKVIRKSDYGPGDDNSKGFTEDEARQIEKDIETIRKSGSTGKSLIERLEALAETIAIINGQSMQVEASYDPRLKQVRLRLDRAYKIETDQSNREKFEGPRLIAHELGHATGALDAGTNQMDNIERWENPIAKDLKLARRVSYLWWW